MKPGRELDALVAEKVMGWKGCDSTETWVRWEHGDPGDEWTNIDKEWCRGAGHPPTPHFGTVPIPRYSVKIDDSWKVVEKLRKTHCCLTLKSEYDFVWECYAIQDHNDSEHNSEVIRRYKIYAMADTAPHAICIAALKAVGIDVTQETSEHLGKS